MKREKGLLAVIEVRSESPGNSVNSKDSESPMDISGYTVAAGNPRYAKDLSCFV